jgi:hypothetical protein
MSNLVQEHPELTPEVIEIYHQKYVSTVNDIVCKFNPSLDANLISLSEHAVGQALAEANKDIKAMQQRRQFKNGISASKIAGIITFRLVRWTPVQLHSPQSENESALKINFMAAFAFVLKYILNVDLKNFPPNVTREFQYNIARRHTNQETLGLAYEMLEYHMTAQKG